MNLRFSVVGVSLWLLSAVLFLVRGYHPNFLIPAVVGTVIFLYGIFSK